MKKKGLFIHVCKSLRSCHSSYNNLAVVKMWEGISMSGWTFLSKRIVKCDLHLFANLNACYGPVC